METVYHSVPHLGGSSIIFEYIEDKGELSVQYTYPKSRLKESIIVLPNENIHALNLNIAAECNFPFVKDMAKDEGFHESQTFKNSPSY